MLAIWNNAYNIYIEDGYEQMWKYLENQVKDSDLNERDIEMIAEDVVNTADL